MVWLKTVVLCGDYSPPYLKVETQSELPFSISRIEHSFYSEVEYDIERQMS
jgi:hypothetical protein